MDDRTEARSLLRQVAVATGSAMSRWWLALALYLPALITGLLSAAPVFLGMQALATIGPWATDIASGDLANAFFELTAGSEGLAPEAIAVLGGAGWGLLWTLLGVPLLGVLYNFFAGGILESVAVPGSGRFFWQACRRWFWPMIRVGLAGFFVLVVLGLAGLIVVGLLPIPRGLSWWLSPLLAVLWLAVVNGLLEAARASIVVTEDPRALVAIGRVLGLATRGRLLGPALAVWLALGLAGAFHALAGAFLVLGSPGGTALAALLVTQAHAFAGAVLKMVRLGAAAGIARAAWPDNSRAR